MLGRVRIRFGLMMTVWVAVRVVVNRGSLRMGCGHKWGVLMMRTISQPQVEEERRAGDEGDNGTHGEPTVPKFFAIRQGSQGYFTRFLK